MCISSRTAPALHTPRGKGVRLPPACETFLGSPASFAASHLPPACARNAARLIFFRCPRALPPACTRNAIRLIFSEVPGYSHLGSCCPHGIGTPVDETKAADLFQKAADLEDAWARAAACSDKACFLLGLQMGIDLGRINFLREE